MKTLIITLCLFMIGCSDKYYESQIAYYNAQIELNKVPVARMVAPDGTEFVVNNQGSVRQAENPVVKTISVLSTSNLASILSTGWSLSKFITATAQHKTTTTTQAPPIVVNQPEPVIVNQPAPVEQPAPIIVTQPEPTIVTQPEPTIVTQPEPIILQE
jgi:hypothetical protein